MPLHKILLGNKLKAAKWLGFAARQLKRLGGRFSSRIFIPTRGIEIEVSRVGSQEYIKIFAQLQGFIYEFVSAFYEGEGQFGRNSTERTRHREIGGKVSSVREERGVAIASYEVDELDDTYMGIPALTAQHLWRATSPTVDKNTGDVIFNAGTIVVKAGGSYNYATGDSNNAVAMLTHANELPIWETRVHITDLLTGTETTGPASMVVVAAAINNGVLVGIDRFGKVYASSTFNDTGVVTSITPAMPSFLYNIGGNPVDAIPWKFNSDGTKAIAAMQKSVDYGGGEYGVDPTGGGGIIEMVITADKDEEGNVILSAIATETAVPSNMYHVFAADYYFDTATESEERIVADIYLEGTEDTDSPAFSGEGDYFDYVRMLNLDTGILYKTVFTGMSRNLPLREEGSNIIANGIGRILNNGTDTVSGLIALDLSQLAYVTRIAWIEIIRKPDVCCELALDEFGDPIGTPPPDYVGPVCTDGRAGNDIECYTNDTDGLVGISLEAGDRNGVQAIRITGDILYDFENHPFYTFKEPGDLYDINSVRNNCHTCKMRSVISWAGNFATFVESYKEDFTRADNDNNKMPVDHIDNIEMDIVRFKSGYTTTHRELYNELRQFQINHDITPVLTELPNASYSDGAFVDGTGTTNVVPNPMRFGAFFIGGDDLPTS